MEIDELPIVKVCTHLTCAGRGSKEIFQRLQAELHGEAIVRACPDCFDACEHGPNILVNGELLQQVTRETSVSLVRDALLSPSSKSDGRGTRHLSELDSVLDEF
jgi:NADH:ubiquinone oxidoreductase subunit E